MIFLIYWLMGLVVGFVTTILHSDIKTMEAVATNLLFYQLTITLTLTGLQGFIGHVFKSDLVAGSIGWGKGSLFQKELGYAELGHGIAGMLCFWFGGSFWLATIVIICPLYLGAAVVHFKEMLYYKNFNPGNSVTLIPDLLMPASLIVLYILAEL